MTFVYVYQFRLFMFYPAGKFNKTIHVTLDVLVVNLYSLPKGKFKLSVKVMLQHFTA